MIRYLAIQMAIMFGAMVGAAIALFVAFSALFEDGPHLAMSLLGGLILGVALMLGRNALIWLSRRRLLAGAAGRVVADGRQEIALRGTIHAMLEPPLVLPFLPGPVVSASYQVSAPPDPNAPRRSGKSQRVSSVTHMSGIVSVGAALRVEGVDIPILAYASPLDFPEQRIPANSVADGLVAHAAGIRSVNAAALGMAEAVSLVNSFGPDGPIARRDEFALTDLAEALERPGALLKVQAIPEGAEVCVIGTYEPGSRAIDASPNWGGVSIYAGDATRARRYMLRKAVGTGVVAALMAVFSTFGLGAIMALDQIDDATRLAELRSAVRTGQVELARPLLARGLADDPATMRALVDAAPNSPMLRLLSDHGADLDGPAPDGEPWLISAAMTGLYERSRDLIEAGASVAVRGGPGRLTALEWAADLGNILLAQYLHEERAPGRVADPFALEFIDDPDDPALAVLAALYTAGPLPVSGGFGAGIALEFEGGLSDGTITTHYLNDGQQTRAHVMERRGADWELLRVTAVGPVGGEMAP